MEGSHHINLILGPKHSGKTSFYNFISGKNLRIEKSGLKFNISHSESFHSVRRSHYFNNFCDLPGLSDTRGDESNFSVILNILSEIQNFETFRLFLLVDESYICMNNGENFLNFVQDVIEILNVESEHAAGLALIVSKSSAGFCSNISEYFEEVFPNGYNFFIEGIIERKIKVFPFDKPEINGNGFEMVERNKDEFLRSLNDMDSVNCDVFVERLSKRVENKLISMRNNLNRWGNITFTSEISGKKLVSDYILCVDKDLNLISEELELNAPIIYVLPSDNKKKIYFQVSGNQPVVRIHENVKKVIHGKALVISTKNIRENVIFPDPIPEEFNLNHQFFRLESICVNGFWTEYASHNNKYIDLIVYLNPNFGRIESDPFFKIKTITIDLKLKLFINECMRTKKKITERFPSIRMFKNLQKYLKNCKKSNLSPEIKESLENYVLKLPNIFQLLMKTIDLNSFSSDSSEIKDLIDIKGILLKKYLKLVTDTQNFKVQIEPSDQMLASLSKFVNFCHTLLGSNIGEISVKNSKLLKGLKKVLNSSSVDEERLLDFYAFFDYLSTCKEKEVLVQYQITGDLSIYPNYQALINQHLALKIDIDEVKSNLLNLGNGILAGAGVAFGIGVTNAGRYFFMRGVASTAIRASVGVTGVIASIAGAAMLVGDLGINLICAVAKSGYFNGEFKPDPKYYRLDV